MNSRPQRFAVTAIAGLLLSIAFSAQSQESDSKPAYVRTGQETTLTGTVAFTGKPPKPLKIDMSADPSCYQHNPNPSTDWLLVKNGRVANVVVYVANSAVLDNYSFAPPASTVVLEHKGCRYEPHVMGIRAGQTLSIVNSDDTHHNTHPNPKLNVEWNMTQPPGAPPILKAFQRTEVAIPFKDNQHPWEKAYVAVFSHPYFSITDANGEFKIEGLPPGHYRLVVWHEEMGEKTKDVTLVPGESRFVSFDFELLDLKDSRLMRQGNY